MLDIAVVYSICTFMCIINCCLKIYVENMKNDALDDDIDIEIVHAEPIRSESEVYVKVILSTNDIVD